MCCSDSTWLRKQKKLNHEIHECPFSRKFLKKKWGAQNAFLKEIQQLCEFKQ